MEQAAATAASLKEQAGKLERTVDVFKIDGMAASRQTAIATTPKKQIAVAPAHPVTKPASSSIPEPRSRMVTEPAGGDWEQF